MKLILDCGDKEETKLGKKKCDEQGGDWLELNSKEGVGVAGSRHKEVRMLEGGYCVR